MLTNFIKKIFEKIFNQSVRQEVRMPGPGSYLFGKEELNAALEVLERGYLFRYGEPSEEKFLHKVFTLEKTFTKYCNSNHALATTSGTSALLSALVALGLKAGDEILVPAYTFVASYSTCIFAGLIPVLCEIDKSLTIDPVGLENKITSRTRAIMPVHMLGNPCRMKEIMAIAKKNKLLVLEDSCQAMGGSYFGKKLGTIGDIGVFSLNFFKTINSGDGGLLVTNDQVLYEKTFGFHDQGHKPLRMGVEVGARSILGLNFRMNELTAAVALAQLCKLDNIISILRMKKKKLKDIITGTRGITFRTLNDPDGDCATLCTVLFDSAERARKVCDMLGTKTVDKSGWHVYANMEHVLNFLKESGQPHKKGDYPVTDDILSRSVNISVGVVDGGLGAGWGINILSSDEEIKTKADQFIKACQQV